MLGLPLLRPPTSQRIPPIWQILQISSCQSVTSFASRSRDEFPRAKLRLCFVLFTGLCVVFFRDESCEDEVSEVAASELADPMERPQARSPYCMVSFCRIEPPESHQRSPTPKHKTPTNVLPTLPLSRGKLQPNESAINEYLVHRGKRQTPLPPHTSGGHTTSHAKLVLHVFSKPRVPLELVPLPGA